jgi:hypothetical protein
MVTALRVASNKEGKGGKAMVTVNMGGGQVDSNGTKEGNGNDVSEGGRGRGQWQGRQEQW